jgi:hypothetical protein
MPFRKRIISKEATMETVQTGNPRKLETVQTEDPGKLAALAKCAHPACICTVGSGERFCSDYCAEQANAGKSAADDACNCGHAECVHSAGARGKFGGPIL